jgi:hypothetical protein
MSMDEHVDPLSQGRRSAEEIAKSPFSADNLDVPAYLRRQIEKDGDTNPM